DETEHRPRDIEGQFLVCADERDASVCKFETGTVRVGRLDAGLVVDVWGFNHVGVGCARHKVSSDKGRGAAANANRAPRFKSLALDTRRCCKCRPRRRRPCRPPPCKRPAQPPAGATPHAADVASDKATCVARPSPSLSPSRSCLLLKLLT